MNKQRLERELLALKNKEGLIVAEQAEAWAARNRQSELAQNLEWNDKKAGKQFRINQVRQLIVSLDITMGPRTKRFFSLSIDRHNGRGGGYRDINEIMQSQNLYDILLSDALNELQRMKEQYERLTELQPLWEEAERVRKKRKPKKGKDDDGDQPSA